jgi:hypothetical protein
MLALCFGLTLLTKPTSAADLSLPPVPHYGEPFPLSAPQPIKPPRYTERQAPDDHPKSQEGGSETFRQRLVAIVNRTLDDPIALFTFVLAGSTIGLWIVTWRSEVRQSKDTLTAFISTNRPKVVLRRILYVPITMDGPLDVHFRLSNIGASDAVIRLRHFHFEFSSGKGIPTHDLGTDSEPIRLAAGESVELYYASRTDDWESVFEDIEVNGNRIDVYWVGQIVYEDGAGIQRSTGFRRRFDRESYRWVRTDDPDEEYSD